MQGVIKESGGEGQAWIEEGLIDRRAWISVATAKSREALYYRMIGAGQFTSDGWLIGERIWFDGNEIKCECWPLPPAKKD